MVPGGPRAGRGDGGEAMTQLEWGNVHIAISQARDGLHDANSALNEGTGRRPRDREGRDLQSYLIGQALKFANKARENAEWYRDNWNEE